MTLVNAYANPQPHVPLTGLPANAAEAAQRSPSGTGFDRDVLDSFDSELDPFQNCGVEPEGPRQRPLLTV